MPQVRNEYFGTIVEVADEMVTRMSRFGWRAVEEKAAPKRRTRKTTNDT
ncbi:MAG: hypothetical protein J2P17_30790 [Mycobacterium sp.]|nr:hypothetical protein [Mycobacterium sp.]